MSARRPPDLDTRQDVLRAATRLFARHGFDGVSVQALAEAVGVRAPSVLHHFGNKQAIREAVLDALLAHWKEELPRGLAAAQSARDRLEGLLRAFLGFFQADPDRARLMLREILDRPDVLRARLRDDLAPWTGLIADAIRAGQAEGRIHAGLDPEAWLIVVITAGVGAVATHPVTIGLVPAGREPGLPLTLDALVDAARRSLFVLR